MIDVGEETGDMDKMLEKIANNFDEEADVLVGSMMSLLEPIMILFLGVIVGTIVLAMFLPMIASIGRSSGTGRFRTNGSTSDAMGDSVGFLFDGRRTHPHGHGPGCRPHPEAARLQPQAGT